MYRIDNKDELEAFMNARLRITVVGKMSFVDAFGDAREQRFGCLCVGGEDAISMPMWTFSRFDGALGHIPTDAQDTQQQG